MESVKPLRMDVFGTTKFNKASKVSTETNTAEYNKIKCAVTSLKYHNRR